MITLTEKQKQIIEKLNHKLFTVEYIEEWINRDDNVFINAPAALSAIECKGFFEAVKALESCGVLFKDDSWEEGILWDWYVASVDNSEPVWTEEHISELVYDFYVIPKPIEEEDV